MPAINNPPPLLCLQFRGSTGVTPKVLRLMGGVQLIQVGPDLPAGDLETPSDYASIPTGRVLHFRNKIYVTIKDKIYCLDEGLNPTSGDDSWTLVHTFSPALNINDGYTHKTGLYIVNVGDTPTLAMFYQDTGNNIQLIDSTNGVNWNTTQVLSTGLTSEDWGKSWSFRDNLLVSTAQLARGFIQVNVTSKQGTYHGAEFVSSGSKASDIVVFDDRVWMVTWTINAASGRIGLWELTGGTFVHRFNLIDGLDYPRADFSVGLNGSPNLFTDGINMYCIAGGIGPSGFGNYAFKIFLTGGPGSSVTFSEITSNVLPTYLRTGSSTMLGFDRWFVFSDNNVDPENPSIHLWHQRTGTLNFGHLTYYRWNGENSVIGNSQGSGSPAFPEGIALPHTHAGGGERIWTPQQASIEIINKAPVEGGEAFSFKVYSYTGTDAKLARFYFNSKQHTSNLPATIRPTSVVGGIYGSDTLGDYISVTANGTTVYSFIWESELDGIEESDIINFTPYIKAI